MDEACHVVEPEECLLCVQSKQRKPLWLLPNLLSLDAPLVAMAWLYVFTTSWRVTILPWTAYLTLGLVVWIIYASDRLLDAAMHSKVPSPLSARHDFHKRFYKFFVACIVLASLTALYLIVTSLSMAIYSYAVIAIMLVAVFFALSFYSTQGPNELPYAKNCVAGITFAFGTAIIAMTETSFYWLELVFSPELLAFTILCTLNITAIDLWEQASRRPNQEIDSTSELILTLPLILLGAGSILFAWREQESTLRPFFYATLTGAGLLHLLNRNRTKFSIDALRVLADMALILPVLVFNASQVE